MKVILLEDDQAYQHLMMDIRKLVRDTIKEVKEQEKQARKESVTENEDWVSEESAKGILGIKGRSKMVELRDNREIEFSQHGRIIRYYKPSLYEFLKRNLIKRNHK